MFVSEKAPTPSPWDASSHRQIWILSPSLTASGQTCCRSHTLLPISTATIPQTLFLPRSKPENTTWLAEVRWGFEVGKREKTEETKTFLRNMDLSFHPPKKCQHASHKRKTSKKCNTSEVLVCPHLKRTCHLQRGGASGAASWASGFLVCSALSIWICCGQRTADTFEAFRVQESKTIQLWHAITCSKDAAIFLKLSHACSWACQTVEVKFVSLGIHRRNQMIQTGIPWGSPAHSHG